MALFLLAYVGAFLGLAYLGIQYGGTDGMKKMMHSGSKAPDRVVTTSGGLFGTELEVYDLPRMTVDVTGGSGGHKRVRMDISLEVAKKDLPRIEGYKPRITDHIISYMQHKNMDNVSAPSYLRDLHDGLKHVVTVAGQPVAIHDVVLRQFVVM